MSRAPYLRRGALLQHLRGALHSTGVRRCKLNPKLESTRFQIFNLNEEKLAFNLKPGFLSLRRYTPGPEAWRVAAVRRRRLTQSV